MFEPEITILLNPTSVGSIVNWEDGERPLHNYKTNVKRGEELSALCSLCWRAMRSPWSWWRVSDVTEMLVCYGSAMGLLGCHQQISLSCWREAADIIRCAQGAPASQQELPTNVREVFTVPREERRPMLGSSPCWKRLLALSQLRIYYDTMLNGHLNIVSRCEIGTLVGAFNKA